MTSYAEARKRGFSPAVIQPRLGDRRAGENAAEVAARRAAELAGSADAEAKAAKVAAEAAALDAKAAEQATKAAGAEVRQVAAEARALKADVDKRVGVADAAKATADGLAGQIEQASAAAGEAKEQAGRALVRAGSAEAVARDAGSRAAQAAKLAGEVGPVVQRAGQDAQAARALAQEALAAATARGVHVVSIALEHRDLVVKHSDGTESKIFLPLEAERRGGRKGKGGTGVGGGLNRTKVISLIEDRMVYREPAYLDDQTSGGTVLTFTFSEAVDKVWVELHETMVDDEATARVTVDGTTPDSNTGTLIHAGVPHPMTASVTTVKVLAADTKVVSVWGYRR